MRVIVTACFATLLLAAPAGDRASETARFNEIRQRLLNTDSKVRKQAATHLGYIAQELRFSGSQLAIALEFDTDPAVRAEAAHALSQMGPLVGKNLEFQIRRALKGEKDDDMRARIIGVLASMAPYSKAAVPDITAHLTHKNRKVKMYAVCALGAFGPDARSAVPALIEALRDPDKVGTLQETSISHEAAMTLAQIGPAAEAATDVLIELFKSSDDSRLRGYAAGALAKIAPKDKRLVPLFVGVLKDKDRKWLRGHAAGALGLMGADAKASVPDLINALQNCDIEEHQMASRARVAAVWALGQIATEEAIAAVRQAISDGDEEVRTEVKSILKRLDKR
jgi:HEAT repeat protein